ncbi:MAG: Cell division protein FtsX [Eubacteriales bacterium SKADARSKE-1]|nr:Cell division protein FtsX [Eubacteriales bacterium SKADARSKE-1]
MKVCSVKYLLAEGFRNVWKNWMMSIASIGVLVLCLVLTGSSALLSLNITNALGEIESKNSIKVCLKEDVDTDQAMAIGEKLKNIDNIASCEFYSREEAAEKYREQMGAIFDSMKDRNFLPHAFHITLKDISRYGETVEKIKQVEGVDTVVNRSELFEKLTKFDHFVSLAGIAVVLILTLVSLFIISNTIRLTMYNRRFEISIMKSVGATDWFVRLPFMVEGMIIGIISAIISSIILKFFYDFVISCVEKNISFFHTPFSDVSLPLFFSFLLAGIGFGLIGGLISISKYLKKEGGEVLGW